MDIKAYINSGILEQYCFGFADSDLEKEVIALRAIHPEIRKELDGIELVIEQLALSQAIMPKPVLKSKIMAALDLADEIIDLYNLPPTGKYSNHENWFKAVEHLIPAEPIGDFFAHVLWQDDQLAQTLVITKLNVPEEVHEVVAESFFILRGTCACTVGKEVFTLHAGDHLDIPLHTNHDIKILSPYVIAILQHQFA